MLVDYHVHSDVSEDSSASMGEMAAAEAAAGVKLLCFTNHCDLLCWQDGRPNPRCRVITDESAEKLAELRAAGEGPVELRLGLGLGSLHAQADHLGKGNGSSVGAAPQTACDAPSPAPASALPRWLPGSLGAGLTLRRVSVVEVLTTGMKVSL